MTNALTDETYQQIAALYRSLSAYKRASETLAKDMADKPQGMISDLQEIVNRARLLGALPNEPYAVVSDMDRTRRTHLLGHLSNRPAKSGDADHELTQVGKEIYLSQELSPEEAKLATQQGLRGSVNKMFAPPAPEGEEKMKEKFGIMPDNNETRAYLTDIEHAFKGGETMLGYAQRQLTSFVATILKATGQAPENISVDDLSKTIQPPTKDQAAHIMAVQSAVKKAGRRPDDAYRPELVYEPLARALRNMPDGTTLIVKRHAETAWVDMKWLTGGGADLPLNAGGEKTAVVVGILSKLYQMLEPASGPVIDITGHSGGNALREASICAALPEVDQGTNGAYKTDAPHIMTWKNGKLTVKELTMESLGGLIAAKAPQAAAAEEKRYIAQPSLALPAVKRPLLAAPKSGPAPHEG